MQSVLIAMEGRYEVIISSCTTGTRCQSKVGLALQACEFSFSILNTPYTIFHTLLRMKQVNHCHSWHWRIPPESLLHFLSHRQSTGTRPFSTCRPRNQYVVQSSDLKLLTRKQYIQRHSAGFPVHLKEALIKNQAASHLRAAFTLHSSAVPVGIQAVLHQTAPRKRTMKLKL